MVHIHFQPDPDTAITAELVATVIAELKRLYLEAKECGEPFVTVARGVVTVTEIPEAVETSE